MCLRAVARRRGRDTQTRAHGAGQSKHAPFASLRFALQLASSPAKRGQRGQRGRRGRRGQRPQRGPRPPFRVLESGGTVCVYSMYDTHLTARRVRRWNREPCPPLRPRLFAWADMGRQAAPHPRTPCRDERRREEEEEEEFPHSKGVAGIDRLFSPYNANAARAGVPPGSPNPNPNPSPSPSPSPSLSSHAGRGRENERTRKERERERERKSPHGGLVAPQLPSHHAVADAGHGSQKRRRGDDDRRSLQPPSSSER